MSDKKEILLSNRDMEVALIIFTNQLSVSKKSMDELWDHLAETYQLDLTERRYVIKYSSLRRGYVITENNED